MNPNKHKITPLNTLYKSDVLALCLITLLYSINSSWAATHEPEDSKKTPSKTYTGERLSLNFQDIEVRSVIAILSEFTHQNIVAGDDITGTITLKLTNVPWDEALDFILMTKGLEKFQSGTVTLIAPAGKIKDYKAQQLETEATIEQSDPLFTEYIKINYAKAETFRNLLN